MPVLFSVAIATKTRAWLRVRMSDTAEKRIDIFQEKTLYARVTRRILPVLFVCYVIAYLDRVNVGFAKLDMLHDLGFSEAVYGLGAGIFFLGYCSAEVPSNIMLARFGARRCITRILITWGIASACMLFVRGANSFYAMRC